MLEVVTDLCRHARMRSTAVILRDGDGEPTAIAVTVCCHDCGGLFEFAGVETTATVLVSEDRTELRLLICPQKQNAPQV